MVGSECPQHRSEGRAGVGESLCLAARHTSPPAPSSPQTQEKEKRLRRSKVMEPMGIR